MLLFHLYLLMFLCFWSELFRLQQFIFPGLWSALRGFDRSYHFFHYCYWSKSSYIFFSPQGLKNVSLSSRPASIFLILKCLSQPCLCRLAPKDSLTWGLFSVIYSSAIKFNRYRDIYFFIYINMAITILNI